MNLADLAAYAREKYQIKEDHKWASFPGFSVLEDPKTGKWTALFIRQWDGRRGRMIEWCDIKFPWKNTLALNASYLHPPIRMKGKNWVGVSIDDSTDPKVVYALFDKAMHPEDQGAVIILDRQAPRNANGQALSDPNRSDWSGQVVPPPKQRVLDLSDQDPDTSGRALGSAAGMEDLSDQVPDRIRAMRSLYVYAGGSYEMKVRNFCRQGAFMADYQDDFDWKGDYFRYFPTYQDLTVNQLRGYFSWRTKVRQGIFQPFSSSLACMYIYELLCGIGCKDSEDSLAKMEALKKGFFDSGIGDPEMGRNLEKWMMEYAIVYDLPGQKVRQLAQPALLEKDRALAVLKNPEASDDKEVVDSILLFAGSRAARSPIFKKDQQGYALMAAAWRLMAKKYLHNGEDFFTACFGKLKKYAWYPLANTIHLAAPDQSDRAFVLDPCRVYVLKDRAWSQEHYDSLYLNRGKLQAFFHEADRLIRKQLKTGAYLKAKGEEVWVTPYVQEAIADWTKAEEERKKPAITIDFSKLNDIRRDAGITRDSLLTEEEKGMAEELPAAGQPAAPSESPRPEAPQPKPAEKSAEEPATPQDTDPYIELLSLLLEGKPVDDLIRQHHWMASVVTDAINEKFFDQIGDNILECDGRTISLVEDYRDDIEEIVKENR